MYDYRAEMTKDIIQWIKDNDIIEQALQDELDLDELAEQLNDNLWIEDSITGNGGGFYDKEVACEEYVCHNLTLYFEAANEFCDFPTKKTSWIYNNPAQYIDCTIRCYLLNECIYEALKELDYERKLETEWIE